MKERPFFVYGTLLPEQPNYDLWSQHIVHQEPAIYPNGRLFDLGAYPVLLEGKGGPIAGQLVTIGQQDYGQVLLTLDALEGYDPQEPEAGDYRRYERMVRLTDGRQQLAWVYLGRETAVAGAALIPSGDWMAHMTAKEREIIVWRCRLRFGKTE
jgi:gamma-glutamylcyclotransferase (GGCT)/AIG2-like uncharacterized protein YtfP